MTERRYQDDEVRRIFGLATTQKAAEPPVSSKANGLTLAEMQSIGLEVGVDPDAVARAAAALDTTAPHALRTSLGVPIEVARTVPLARALTDHEWEQLVAELRTTFRAKGKITTHGALREWTNGNLHASIEPTGSGYRLRMGTVKGDATGLNLFGVSGLLASGVTFASLAFWGLPVTTADLLTYLVPITLGGGGIGALLANRIRLPRWAKERGAQMDHIAARIRAIMAANSESGAGDR